MPPKRTLSPVRTAAKKPVRTTDSSKSGSKNAANIRSLSPTGNYSGPRPNSTSRQGSNISSDDSAGSGGPLWQMPRRGGSGPAPISPKKAPKKFNSTPPRPQASSKPESLKWKRNGPTPSTHSEGDKRAGGGRRPMVIDISSSEEDDSDSSIEILVPPKPQSAKLNPTPPKPQSAKLNPTLSPVKTTEKRKVLPDRTKSMDERSRPAKAKATSQAANEAKPIKRMNSLNVDANASSTSTPSGRSRSRTVSDNNRGRSHSPVLFKSEEARVAKKESSKRGVTASPVLDYDDESPTKQKKSVSSARFQKKNSPDFNKKETIRPPSPVSSSNPYPMPTLSPLVKEKQTVGRDRRQSTAVDGRTPMRERSPTRNNLPGRRVVSVATEESHTPPPPRPSNPPPQRNAPPPVPKKTTLAVDGLDLSTPVGQPDPRRQSTAVDGRARSRSPHRNQIPGRRVVSIATEDAQNPTVPRSDLNLGGGRASILAGRRVQSMAPDEGRPSVRRSKSSDDMPFFPRRKSTAAEEMGERTSRSGRPGGSGSRPHASRSPPPRSSSGRGGGRGRGGRGGRIHQTEFDSVHQMPASLQNRYGAQLGRFASSGGRSSGGRGGVSVFSGRVTADGRKVPTAPVVRKPKVVIPVGGTPYNTAGRPVVPNAGSGGVVDGGSAGRQPQSFRTPNPQPMVQPNPPGRKKRRDSGGASGNGGAPTRGSGARSPTNVPRSKSPVREPKKKIFTKIQPETKPFMFPIDDPDILREVVQPGGTVRILICSANLGNAQPDDLSLNEWVPADGSMRYVLTTPQRYPVMLNFPREEKKQDPRATDRAVYDSIHTRPSQLLTINEFPLDESEVSFEEDSALFSIDQSYIQLPSSEIIIETVDEDADDDHSVILQDTMEVRRSIRKSLDAKPAKSELPEIAEEKEPDNIDSEVPSDAAEEPDVDVPSEAIQEPESEGTAMPDKEIEPTEEEPEETMPEPENDTPGEHTQGETEEDELETSENGGEMDVPRRYTQSSQKLESIRKRIEDSIKQSRADGGFTFGEDFQARQRALLQAEKLRNQEARERLHLGSMAPDQAATMGETFLEKQSLTKSEEREKARATRDMLQRGSLGVGGRKSIRFGNIAEEDSAFLSPSKNTEYLQAVPAQIRLDSPVPESEGTGESKDSEPAAVDPKKDDQVSGSPSEGVHTEGSSQQGQHLQASNANESASENTTDKSLPNDQGAEHAADATSISQIKQSIDGVAQSSDEEGNGIGIAGSDDPANDGGENDVSEGVVEEDDDLGNNNDFAHLDSSEDWQNNDDFVEEEPYYEEGPDDHFEIIVIGMQEATFDPNADSEGKESGLSESDRSQVSKSDRTSTDASDSDASDDEDEEEGSDEDEDDDDYEDDDSNSDEEELNEAPKSSKSMNGSELSPKKGKGILQIAKNAMKKGKKGLKAAHKTSKAVKTLLSERNHTKRELPFFREQSEDGAMAKWEDTDVLHFLFDGQLPSYERALSYQLGQMRLMVYYLKSSVEVDVLSVKAKATGKHNIANKGGIVTEVAVNRSTRLCFSSAHLEAHEGAKKFEKRINSFERIFHSVNSSVTALNFDPTMSSHYSFFMGDLNFRTKLPNLEAGSDEHIQASHELTARRKWEVLNRHDELSNALAEKKCLAGWKTPYCNFDPTFKVARQDGYNYNVLRSPSYTDRILYKAIDQLEDTLEVSLYEPITHYTSSDHKPIRGAFEVQLTEKLDLKPRIPTKTKEKLHILFTSIELSLDSDKYKPNKKSKNEDEVIKPNPFVSFISTPRDALELDASSRKRSTWKRFGMNKTFTRTKPGRTKSNVGDVFNPLSAQWPGSSVMEGTFNPKWEAEEIHFELGMKNKTNNRPLDLSGALMHVSVFDGRDSNPKLLGSFTLNLAALIRMTIESDTISRGSSRHARAIGIQSGAGKSYQRRLSRQPSSRLTGLIESLADELDQDSQESKRLRQLKITTLHFNEPLLDCGIQTGTIKCSVDAWWMQEEEEE